jgi:RimJ/RimL family protein N-acetyltransferase
MSHATNPWQPTLRGARVTLRPLVAEDFAELFAAASDPGIWEQHPDPLRWRRDRFQGFFDGALACGGGLTVLDSATGEVIGSSRYYDWVPAERSVVVGYTFLTRAYWGSGANREMKALMLAHAFERVDTVFFHVGPENLRSQRALERIGARFDHETEVRMGDTRNLRRVYRMDAPRSSAASDGGTSPS